MTAWHWQSDGSEMSDDDPSDIPQADWWTRPTDSPGPWVNYDFYCNAWIFRVHVFFAIFTFFSSNAKFFIPCINRLHINYAWCLSSREKSTPRTSLLCKTRTIHVREKSMLYSTVRWSMYGDVEIMFIFWWEYLQIVGDLSILSIAKSSVLTRISVPTDCSTLTG